MNLLINEQSDPLLKKIVLAKRGNQIQKQFPRIKSIPFGKRIVWHFRESKQFPWNQTFFCFQLSIQLLLKRKLFAPESPNDWGCACKTLINNRFYKHSGSLGFASSKPSINNRIYKRSGRHGITISEHAINDRFYKQFWPLYPIGCQP